MRQAGLRGKSIFNVNAGFWIVRRDVIKTFCELAFRFWEIGRKRGYTFTEEAPLAYAMQMLCSDPRAHQMRRWTDVWATDWQGVLGKRLPDAKPWIFRDYFTFEELKVNPAIVHIVGCKEVMIASALKGRLRMKKRKGPIPLKPLPRRRGRADRSASAAGLRGTR
jgi:hypothetical protein